jgi:hypothetical protein
MALESPPDARSQQPSHSDSERSDPSKNPCHSDPELLESSKSPCHSDPERSEGEEPAFPRHYDAPAPCPESALVRQRHSEIRRSMQRSALGLGAVAAGSLLLWQLTRKR